MASYLDYLFPMGQTMQPTPGLLSEEDAQRMRQQAQQAGLLSFGANLLAASGPTSQPMSFGQRLAPAILGGYQAAQGTLADQQRQLAERAKALQEESVVLPEGGTLVGKRTGNVVAQGAPKLPGTINEFVTAKKMGLIPENMTLTDFQNLKTPKTVLDMTGGQKGFENEMKLRGEFKSEPVYKAFNEMQSAYGQITDSLKKQSPAGDLAGATKFMKLLDPGSVVRESELALAMAATGALDRATNYAQSIIKGTKLTPKQREDFQTLANTLYGTASDVYNAKRSELVQQGQDYGLNAERALGAPAKGAAISTGMPSMSAIDAEIARRKKGQQ